MSWSPPPSQRDSTPKWDLYRTRRPGGSRRRWPFAVAAAVVAGGVTALVIVLAGGRTGSGAPTPSSPAARYLRLSDDTLRQCPLDDAQGFARCLATVDGGLTTIRFPASAQQVVSDMRTVVTLARGCVAEPDPDAPEQRTWPPYCPQADAGSTDPTTAASRDDAARKDFFSQLRDDDARVRSALGLSPPPLPGILQ